MASPGKKSFLLRVDPALWAEIERMAADELRSTNAQVEYLLRDALQRRGRRVPAGAARQNTPRQAAAPAAAGLDSEHGDDPAAERAAGAAFDAAPPAARPAPQSPEPSG
jgi:hypothetical protein